MPLHPMLYGSGVTKEANSERTGEPQPQSAPSPLMVLNEILMAPLNLLSMTMGSQSPQGKQVERIQERAFLPQGGVKPEMTTQQMRKANIFGEGGGY